METHERMIALSGVGGEMFGILVDVYPTADLQTRARIAVAIREWCRILDIPAPDWL